MVARQEPTWNAYSLHSNPLSKHLGRYKEQMLTNTPGITTATTITLPNITTKKQSGNNTSDTQCRPPALSLPPQ